MIRLSATLMLLAAPAFAQQPGPSVRADLDGDGVEELYTLLLEDLEVADASNKADLAVQTTEGVRVVEDVVWQGRYDAGRPELDVGPENTLLLTAMNDGYGRHRWSETITIAHHNDDLRVTAVSYGWYDPLDLDAGETCDVDLLSGRGHVKTPEGSREIAAPFPPPLLWDWRAGTFDPLEVCGFK
jgi:hypothetical protein